MEPDKLQNQPYSDYIMKNPAKIPFLRNEERNRYIPSNRIPNPKPDLVETRRILGN